MATALPAPDLHIPHSGHTVTVSIIDTTSHVHIPTSRFVEPPIAGHDRLVAACYGFLIKHDNGDAKSKYDSLLFDLGVRKDFGNSPKSIIESTKGVATVKVEKNVHDILTEHGEDPNKVGGIIWSHWHWVSIVLRMIIRDGAYGRPGPYGRSVNIPRLN